MPVSTVVVHGRLQGVYQDRTAMTRSRVLTTARALIERKRFTRKDIHAAKKSRKFQSLDSAPGLGTVRPSRTLHGGSPVRGSLRGCISTPKDGCVRPFPDECEIPN